jgi:hypothetical protein
MDYDRDRPSDRISVVDTAALGHYPRAAKLFTSGIRLVLRQPAS